MKIRFLETTPSDAPDFPFQPGQIIDIAVSERVSAWLESGAVIALEPEAAVLGDPPEQATEKPPRGRGRR